MEEDGEWIMNEGETVQAEMERGRSGGGWRRRSDEDGGERRGEKRNVSHAMITTYEAMVLYVSMVSL